MCTPKYPTENLVTMAAVHKALPVGFPKGFNNPRTHALPGSMDKLEITSVYNTFGNPCPHAKVHLIGICFLHCCLKDVRK